MGKNNRQRRAAKSRKRNRSRPTARHLHAVAPRGRPSVVPPVDDVAFSVGEVFRFAVAAAAREAHDDLDLVAAGLADRHDAFAAVEEVQAEVELAVDALWRRGWQPADVVRVARSELGKHEVGLVRCAIAADAERYEALGRRVAPAWMAQLDGGDVGHRWWTPGTPYALEVAGTVHGAVVAAARLVAFLATLPDLPTLMAPPGQWHEGMADASERPGELPDGLLDKVRALLAKAESTEFEGEADAFTAKAQELMARYRIDRAMLAASDGRDDAGPGGLRLGVDNPYPEAKATLLSAIADANGCTAVWSKDLGFATVMGYPDDIAVVDELYTSLLVQAAAALRREGSKRDQRGRSRTTRFRRSFLTSFAQRIGERLRDSVDATVAEAVAESASLLPVLAARDEEVRDATERMFPTSTTFRPSVSDREGWYAGRQFADMADVSAGPAMPQ